MKNDAIIRKSLAEEVATAIEEKIKMGTFPVESKLPTEPELMKQFAVGRSTIREAVKYLCQSGYLNVQQGLGTFVKSSIGHHALDAKIEKGNFDDIFEVRQVLEIRIIEKSAVNRTTKGLKDMASALKNRLKYAELNNLIACVEADIAFHSAIAESCGNSILTALYTTLSVHVNKFFMSIYKDTTPFLSSQKQHEELMLAIKDRDVKRAVDIANRIIKQL